MEQAWAKHGNGNGRISPRPEMVPAPLINIDRVVAGLIHKIHDMSYEIGQRQGQFTDAFNIGTFKHHFEKEAGEYVDRKKFESLADPQGLDMMAHRRLTEKLATGLQEKLQEAKFSSEDAAGFVSGIDKVFAEIALARSAGKTERNL